MSSLYTTKSLGRTWLPSPSRPSTRSRYGSWPQTPPRKLRWLSSVDTDHGTPKRWSKTHERITLLGLVLLLGLWWCTCSNTSLLSRTNLHIPSWRPTSISSESLSVLDPSTLQMSEVAYLTYASNTASLCSSLMQLESLHRLNTSATKLLLYPEAWNISAADPAMQLLTRAQETYGAVLTPVDVQVWKTNPVILAANQTGYRRIMVLDPDSTMLRKLDEEFFNGAKKGDVSAGAVLLSPSADLYEELHHAENAGELIAKHTSPITRTLQTSKLRDSGSSSWSAKSALVEANIVHFSDGAPWRPILGSERERLIPTCSDKQTCEHLEVWRWLYTDFRRRRREVCGERFNEWEDKEAQDEANRRIIPLRDRVKGVGGNSGAV